MHPLATGMIICLKGGVEVKIPPEWEYYKCKCGADDLIWATTKSGKKMLVHWVPGEGWLPHWSDCANAAEFRKDKK